MSTFSPAVCLNLDAFALSFLVWLIDTSSGNWYDSCVMYDKDYKKDNVAVADAAGEDSGIEPLISLANALFDIDRLRIAAALLNGPVSRMELAQVTGLPHRELLRQLGLLQYFGLVKAEEPAPKHPDPYSRFELNEEAFRSARQAMSKYRGRKPRPRDSRELTLETFMPGGKLNAFPRKETQLIVILDEVVQKFDVEKQYTESEVNVILEEVNEDYCTLRRCLVDYGYLSRIGGGGAYSRNS